MSLLLTVCAENLSKESFWVEQLRKVLESFDEIRIDLASKSQDLGQAVFVDFSMKNVEKFIEKIDRKGRAIFLIISESNSLPILWKEGKVDDVVIAPFRTLEILSKLRYYDQILMWNEVAELNASISGVLKKLQEDLQLTERLQKENLPKRFPNIKGFKVASRYFAGGRPGGDYFDLAESKDKALLSLILTHSTSYGLSNAVLTALMRVTMKLTLEQMAEDGATAEVVRRIYDELTLTLGEKDQLSFFYGTIHRQDHSLRFLNLGNTQVYYAQAQGEFERLPQQGKAISKSARSFEKEAKIQLETDGRLVLLSYGFVEALGGEQPIRNILNRFREKDATDLLNELAFKMKSKLEEEDGGIPLQDCTTLILDVDNRVIRLTKQEQA
jgi:serine phosphatase RsbU (regulator of sigma subunit)